MLKPKLFYTGIKYSDTLGETVHASDCLDCYKGSIKENYVKIVKDVLKHLYNHLYSNCRLDAGTFGTMGVGVGFAIAAALYCQDHSSGKRVVCIQGDSAFGFSGFEVETVCR